jgi:CubicO group peptidase (beta-lactamase class C family)
MQRALISATLATALVVNLASIRTTHVHAFSVEAPAKVTQLASGTQVDAYLKRAHFHGYIFLMRHGRTILSKGYGMADARHRVPITARTRWPMFGIEDFMVAIAILKLQGEGKLQVQDRLCAHMAGCPGAWRSITLRGMLGGTSPIGQYDPFASSGNIQQTIAQCKAAPLLSASPGVSEESACNRVLLSRVIEGVSRQPFAAFMQQTIFHQAGMTRTSIAMSSPAQSARGYTSGSLAPPLHFGGYPLIYSTPGDIERLDRAVLAGKIISHASVRSLITPYRYDGDPAVSVFNGYGCQVLKADQFFFHDASGGDASGSTGNSSLKTNRAVFEGAGPDWSGFLTDSWFSPDDGTVAIWLNNDTEFFDNSADNRFLDSTAKLLWGK